MKKDRVVVLEKKKQLVLVLIAVSCIKIYFFIAFCRKKKWRVVFYERKMSFVEKKTGECLFFL